MAATDHAIVRFHIAVPALFTPPGGRRERPGHVPLEIDLAVPRIASGEAPVVFRAVAPYKAYEWRAHGDLMLRPMPGAGSDPNAGASAGWLARTATRHLGAAELLGIASTAHRDPEVPAGSRIHREEGDAVAAQARLAATRLRLIDGALHVPSGIPALAFGSGPTGVFFPDLHEGPGFPDAFGFAVDRRAQAERFGLDHHYNQGEGRPELFRHLRIDVAEGIATTFAEARCNARQAARLCLHAASQGIADLPGSFVGLLARLAAVRDAVVAGTEDPFAVLALLDEIHEARPRKDRVVSLDNAIRLGRAAIAASLPYERGGTEPLDREDAGALGALAP